MKKRISLIACILVLMLAFTGCGKEGIDYDKATLQGTASTFITSFSQMPDESLNQYKEASELELDLTMLQSNLPVESENFVQLINTWQAAVEEYGALVSCDFENATVKEKSTEIELVMEAEFTDRSASISMFFDEDSMVTSMAVNGDYTIGEILTKAGLNTVLGMGTVFVVLILISFIIYLLGFVPKLLQKKESAQKPAPAPKSLTAETYTAEEEEVEDDLELVAVISAAIAAAEGTSADGFVVRSIKRRKSNKWI